MAESKAHRKHIRQALNDENLQIALNRAESAYRAAREAAILHQVRSVSEFVPCLQVRSLKTSDRSHALIQRTGAELVEMACCDECCGFAGSFTFKQPGVSSAILNRKLVHIEQTGAQIVATDCPGCIMQLQSGLLDRCAIEVRHTAELIADVLEK